MRRKAARHCPNIPIFAENFSNEKNAHPLFFRILLCGCAKEKLSTSSVHSEPVKLSEYLYEMTYTDYEPSAILEFLGNIDQIALGGACSVVRNGDFVGRNLDYYYCDMAETVIHVPAAPGRYASVGVASCLTDFTPDLIKKPPDSHYFDVIPYTVVDGINERGVYCSVNLVPFDCGATTGTNPGEDTTSSPISMCWPKRRRLTVRAMNATTC